MYLIASWFEQKHLEQKIILAYFKFQPLKWLHLLKYEGHSSWILLRKLSVAREGDAEHCAVCFILVPLYEDWDRCFFLFASPQIVQVLSICKVCKLHMPSEPPGCTLALKDDLINRTVRLIKLLFRFLFWFHPNHLMWQDMIWNKKGVKSILSCKGDTISHFQS